MSYAVELPIFFVSSFYGHQNYDGFMFVLRHFLNICSSRAQSIQGDIPALETEIFFTVAYFTVDLYLIIAATGKLHEKKKTYDVIVVMLFKLLEYALSFLKFAFIFLSGTGDISTKVIQCFNQVNEQQTNTFADKFKYFITYVNINIDTFTENDQIKNIVLNMYIRKDLFSFIAAVSLTFAGLYCLLPEGHQNTMSLGLPNLCMKCYHYLQNML